MSTQTQSTRSATDTSPQAQTRKVHYVLSTHWDREWHQTFQQFRHQLVKVLDRVLDGLRDGRLHGPFVCDGQAVMLEDYLEVRPERRAEIEQRVGKGQLVVGPWYALADEFLVSGESLIRNLELGRKIARQLGGQPSNAGFLADLFGHNSQMPQIFAGFGIKGALLWRGVNLPQLRHALWCGADGTTLPCHVFAWRGYCTYAGAVRDVDHHDQLPKSMQQRREALEHLVAREAQVSGDGPVLLFDGADHQAWDESAYQVIVEKLKVSDDPAAPLNYLHSNLDAYLDDLQQHVGGISHVMVGELRDPGKNPTNIDQQFVIPGVLSSRVQLKQQNASCQTELCHWAEPWCTFAAAQLGEAYPQAYLDLAWRYLLQNHAHDTICGCSIDAVHDDAEYRFRQTQQISRKLTDEALTAIAASVSQPISGDELRVVLFNPLPRAWSGVLPVTLPIPQTWPSFNEFFGFEAKPAFRLFAADDTELMYQRLTQKPNCTHARLFDHQFPKTVKVNQVTVSVDVTIPPMGYTTLTVRAEKSGLPTRHPMTPSLQTSARSMSNEHLTVTVEGDGSVTLTHHADGQTYTGLLTMEDAADIGDGWYHGQAVNDQVHIAPPGDVTLSWVHDGPMLATLQLDRRMKVPADFDRKQMRRSDDMVELRIISKLTLRRDSRALEIESTVHNHASDHRLRVLFPSGADADTVWSDTPFDAVERPIALRKDNHLYRELEVETRPQQSWSAVFDQQRGLAVIADGLMEASVCDRSDRPIALTLLRATERTVMTDGEPGGQVQGELRFKYQVQPIKAGTFNPARLTEMGQQLAAGCRAVALTEAEIRQHRRSTALPLEASMLALSGDAVLTSLRRVNGEVEARLFNPMQASSQVQINPGGLLDGQRTPTRMQAVDLEGRLLNEAVVTSSVDIQHELPAKKILTLRLS